ncbi:condensation domain-containing protein [Vibrio sp. PP-XX7]
MSHQGYPHEAALQWMMQDVQCELDITRHPSTCDQPLYRHRLIQVGTEAQPVWYWYQRYHHIMVDGFSLTAITQRIEQIYHQLRRRNADGDAVYSIF